MYAFYLARGHKLEDLINLNYTEKLFHIVCMEKFNEEEARKYKE